MTQSYLEQLFVNNIDNDMNRIRQENEDNLSTALITKIPTTYCYYNSVNIAVGRQGTGKSYSLIREMIKISKVCPNTHLLIYCNKTGKPTDKTFEKYKKLIDIPILYISHSELEEFMKEFLNYKQLYNRIYEENLGDKIIDEQREDVFNNLYIDNFSSPFLHTLILLDDVAQTKILKNEKTYIQELLTQCRHINCSFFLAVQFWKALTVNIK
jgi:hypothetical protein